MTEELSFDQRNIAEFRASGGRIAAFGDAPVLLLTTIGAASGERRTIPLMYLPAEGSPDRVYVFASAAGADDDPKWLNNALTHPNEVTVEVGEETVPASARVVPDPERGEIYARQAELYSNFAEYEEKTSRVIPVLELDLRR